MHSKLPKFEFRDCPPTKVAKVANFEAGENQLPQVSQWEVSKIISFAPVEKPLQGGVPCSKCPSFQENPWTHDPALGAWCHYRMEHLVVGDAACEEFSRGEVPPRQKYEKGPQVQPSMYPDPQEDVLICANCPQFQATTGPNPRQAWGRCLKRGRGRYGCATACEAALEFYLKGQGQYFRRD